MRYVFLFFLAISYVVATPVVPVPIKKGLHYANYRQSDYIKKKGSYITERVESFYGSGRSAKSWVELPYNDTVPEDQGGNFGDLKFYITEKDGSLLGTDTILNDYYPYNIIIVYEQSYNGLYVKDLKLFNFGRQRGFAFGATIFHNLGLVEAEIAVAAGHQVRILAEAYGDVLK